MSKHTPGPWVIYREDFKKDGAIVQIGPMTPERAEHLVWLNVSDADARLIAAATEMIKALENAIGQFNDRECNCDGEYDEGRWMGHACYFHRIEQDLKDAIAKALGEE